MTVFPKYERYKDSGVEWLEEIPEHWEVEHSKWLFSQRKERCRRDDEQLTASQKYGVIPQSKFIELEGRRVVMVMLNPELLKRVYKGDFVISMRTFQGGIEMSEYDGAVSSAYVPLKPGGEIHSGYFKYLFKTERYIKALGNTSNLIRDGQALRFENFSMVDLPVVPFEEQKRIAIFLDQKTAEIDALIAKKQRQIELLDEQKAILINRAVTRGLNPNVKLKPSGIEWIGDIPEHWETGKIRHLFDNLNNRRIPLSTVDRGKMTERRYDYYGASGVIDKVEDYLYDEDLLLIAEDGANLVFRNLPLAVIATGKYWVNNHAHILRPKSGPLHYWFHALECADYTTSITGAAQPKLTKDAISSISLPNPPLEEQEQILAHIQQSEDLKKSLRKTIEAQLDSLKAFRSTLIAHAVTGRIKV